MMNSNPKTQRRVAEKVLGPFIGGSYKFQTKAFCLLVLILVLVSGCSSDRGSGSHPPLCEPSTFSTYPHDGRLYASLACVPITPDAENHPEPLYLGGYSQNRIAQGIHDDLQTCALLLGQDQDRLVLVSLDLVGIVASRARKITERLETLGADPERVFIACSHTHNGPDTVGLWGRNYLKSGLDMTYQDFLVDAVEAVFLEASDRMQPVEATFATGTVHVPGSNYPALIRDSRDPQVVDPRIHAIRFENPCGDTVATLVNFASHPETALDMDWVSADFPGALRDRLTMELGGGAIYFSGALGGLLTPLGVSVPARDEQGHPLEQSGEPVWLTEASWERTRSYGYVLAEKAIDILRAASPSPVRGIRVLRERDRVPITNIAIWFFFQIGLLEPVDLIHQPGCGLLGCGEGEAAVISFGQAQITTSPGETFPETIVGRQEITLDYGDPWGSHKFPAIDGIAAQQTAPLAMHFTLANDFVGYLVPEADYLPLNHPEFYCEVFSASSKSEATLREGLLRLLAE